MIDYYIQELLLSDTNHHYSVWHVDERVAYRLGIPQPKESINCYFEANDRFDVWGMIKQSTPWFENGSSSKFIKLDVPPGCYFPRMARTTSDHPYDSFGLNPGWMEDENVIAVSIGQLLTLTSQLQGICQTVHPDIENFKAYGHNIRNLLILACTEV